MLKRIRRKSLRVLLAIVGLSPLGILSGGCASLDPPLPVVESVDLERYAGKWYEIASYPNSFQSGCEETTAVYTPRDDGKITGSTLVAKRRVGSFATSRERPASSIARRTPS